MTAPTGCGSRECFVEPGGTRDAECSCGFTKLRLACDYWRSEVERLKKRCLELAGPAREQALPFVEIAILETLEMAARTAESYEPRCESCPRGVASAIRTMAKEAGNG